MIQIIPAFSTTYTIIIILSAREHNRTSCNVKSAKLTPISGNASQIFQFYKVAKEFAQHDAIFYTHPKHSNDFSERSGIGAICPITNCKLSAIFFVSPFFCEKSAESQILKYQSFPWLISAMAHNEIMQDNGRLECGASFPDSFLRSVRSLAQ